MNIIQLLFIVLLVCLIIGLLPLWPYSVGYGIAPSSTIGVVLIILLILLLIGKI